MINSSDGLHRLVPAEKVFSKAKIFLRSEGDRLKELQEEIVGEIEKCKDLMHKLGMEYFDAMENKIKCI